MGEPAEIAAEIAEAFGLSREGELFVEAVTHPSYAHETPSAAHNQRLEFLGDAVLDFVVSELLFQKFPDSAEGKLTRTRSQVVNTGALASYARHLGLSAALRFGKGGSQGNLRDSENVLADAVEALIAAAYLEKGIEQARLICSRVMEFGLSALEEAGARDAKSELQEKLQALGLSAPSYQVVGTQGPAHEVVFEIEVSLQGRVLAAGIGRSKRLAEREAAVAALAAADFEKLPESAGEP